MGGSITYGAPVTMGQSPSYLPPMQMPPIYAGAQGSMASAQPQPQLQPQLQPQPQPVTYATPQAQSVTYGAPTVQTQQPSYTPPMVQQAPSYTPPMVQQQPQIIQQPPQVFQQPPPVVQQQAPIMMATQPEMTIPQPQNQMMGQPMQPAVQQAIVKQEVGPWQICEDQQGEYYVYLPSGQTFDNMPPELAQLIQPQ